MPSHPDRVRRNYADIPVLTIQSMPPNAMYFITPATEEQKSRGDAIEVSPGVWIWPYGCATIKDVRD